MFKQSYTSFFNWKQAAEDKYKGYVMIEQNDNKNIFTAFIIVVSKRHIIGKWHGETGDVY